MKLLSLTTQACLVTAFALGCAPETSEKAHQEGKKEEQKQQEFQPTLADGLDENQEALTAEAKTLPENVVIRVALDEQGNEVDGSAEMAAIDGAVTGESVEADFNSGESIENNANSDDLEGDSSSNSFYAYRGFNQSRYTSVRTVNYGYGGAAVGHHAAYGLNGAVGLGYHNSFRGSRYYNGYRPYRRSLVVGGGYWRFGRPWCYTYRRFRYYQYPRPRPCFPAGRCGPRVW